MVTKRKKAKSKDVKPSAILASDLHLAHGAWAREPRIQGDALFALSQLISLANKHGVPLIVAGDCMDAKAYDSVLVAAVRKILAQLKTQLYYVLGDHDDSELGLFAAFESPKVQLLQGLTAEPVHLPGSEIYLGGTSWLPPARLRRELESTHPATTHLVLHQTLCELAGNRFAGEVSCDDIPASVSHLYIGDVHTQKIFDVERNGNGLLRVVSPGSTVPQAIDELKERSWLWLDAEGDAHRGGLLRHRPTASVELLVDDNLEDYLATGLLSWLDTAAEQAADLPEALRLPLVVIRYLPGLPRVQERVLQVLETAAKSAVVMTSPMPVDNPATEKIENSAVAADVVLADGFAATIAATLSEDVPLRDLLLDALRVQDVPGYLASAAAEACD